MSDEAMGNAKVIGGRFRLLEQIAGGPGYAVWRAERIADFPQTVAIHRPAPDPSQPTAELLASLRAEQRALALVNHHGIAALVDASLAAEGPWLATEFAEGLPLDAFAREHGLTIEQKLALFLQVLDALAHAHRQLVVHGGLSFSRILVNGNGVEAEEGAARVVGFGAEPEPAEGERLSTASDVQAAGRLLYELLTGKPPLEPATRPSAEVAGALRRSLRGDLDAILLCALAAEATSRYADAGALAADLRRHLAHQPVEARHGGPLYRGLRFARRNRLLAAAAALLLLIGSGSGAVVVKERVQTARARAQAETRLADMQRLTDSMLVQLTGELERLDGAAPVEAALARNLSATLDRLAQEAGPDARFRENLAREYLLLAELLERRPQAGLRASEVAARGVAVLTPLMVSGPSERARDLETQLKRVR